jgi:hypothetical protein
MLYMYILLMKETVNLRQAGVSVCTRPVRPLRLQARGGEEDHDEDPVAAAAHLPAQQGAVVPGTNVSAAVLVAQAAIAAAAGQVLTPQVAGLQKPPSISNTITMLEKFVRDIRLDLPCTECGHSMLAHGDPTPGDDGHRRYPCSDERCSGKHGYQACRLAIAG